MFSYSPREGTEAFPWKETVSEELKSARLQTVIDLQNAITLERNKLMLGRIEPVLIEQPSYRNDQEWMGKTGNFKKVVLAENTQAKPGDIISVRINDMRGWTLRGECISVGEKS